MATDWALVRELMAATIDACEAAERLDLQGRDRALPTGTGASVGDALTSAWTYPENVRYAVIRARHAAGDDAPYRPELARALAEAALVCGELVGAASLDAEPAGGGPSIRRRVQSLAGWYRGAMVEQLGRAAATRG